LLHIIRAALRKFIQLDDTPNSYSGLAGKLFKVKSDESGLEPSTNTDSEIADAVNVAANVMEKIAEVEVSSDTDYVEFTGLDGNSAWFYVLFASIKNPTSNNSEYYLFVNEDTTTTNYYTQSIYANGTTIATTNVNLPRLGHCTSGKSLIANVTISKDAADYFRAISLCNRESPTNLYPHLNFIAKSATITNITSLRIQAETASAIGAGSKFILFKVRRA